MIVTSSFFAGVGRILSEACSGKNTGKPKEAQMGKHSRSQKKGLHGLHRNEVNARKRKHIEASSDKTSKHPLTVNVSVPELKEVPQPEVIKSESASEKIARMAEQLKQHQS